MANTERCVQMTNSVYPEQTALDQSDLGQHCLPRPLGSSFVTTASPATGNSGDNNVSSSTALLKALHCKDLLWVIALLFTLLTSTGVYLHNITCMALQGELKGSLPHTVAHYISPTQPGRWRGECGAVVTDDLWITVNSMDELLHRNIASSSTDHHYILMWEPESKSCWNLVNSSVLHHQPDSLPQSSDSLQLQKFLSAPEPQFI